MHYSPQLGDRLCILVARCQLIQEVSGTYLLSHDLSAFHPASTVLEYKEEVKVRVRR